LRQRKIACKSADRGDCTCSSVIGINLQEMSWLLRGRKLRYWFLLSFFQGLEQGRREGYGKIGKELIGLGREACPHNEADQRTVQRAHKQHCMRVEICRPAHGLKVLKTTTKEHEIDNQGGNPAFDGNLQIGHVHFMP